MCLFFTDNKVDLIEVGALLLSQYCWSDTFFLMCLRSKKVQGYSNELTSPCCVCSTFGCVCVRGRVSLTALPCPPWEPSTHTYGNTAKLPQKKTVCYKFSLYNNTKSQKIFEMVVTIYRSFARRLLNFFYILILRQNSEFRYHEKNGGTIISGETFLIKTRELELRSRPPWQADPTQG